VSKTPRTDKAWHATLDWCNKRDRMHDPHHAALANLAETLERDISECLTTLEAAKDHLKQGGCLCEFMAESEYDCDHCRMIDDIEVTLKNCKP